MTPESKYFWREIQWKFKEPASILLAVSGITPYDASTLVSLALFPLYTVFPEIKAIFQQFQQNIIATCSYFH